MTPDPTQPPPAEDLAPLVYAELRRLAAAYMRRERPGQTLQATALVHEAYLRLAGARRAEAVGRAQSCVVDRLPADRR
jgi:ECF sigma factor